MSFYKLYKQLFEQQKPAGTTPATGTSDDSAEPTAPPGTPDAAIADASAMTGASTSSEPTPGATASSSSPAGSGTSEPVKDDSSEPEDDKEETPDDVVSKLEDLKSDDTLKLLKTAKEAILSGELDKDPKKVSDIITKLLATEKQSHVDTAKRLAKFFKLDISTVGQEKDSAMMEQEARKKKFSRLLEKIVDAKFKKLLEQKDISSAIPTTGSDMASTPELGAMDKPVQTAKTVSFKDSDAMNTMSDHAKKVADGLVVTMRDTFNVADEISENDYKKYESALEQLRSAVISAVADASNIIKNLPKQPEAKK
jgi:hypothetical protein